MHEHLNLDVQVTTVRRRMNRNARIHQVFLTVRCATKASELAKRVRMHLRC